MAYELDSVRRGAEATLLRRSGPAVHDWRELELLSELTNVATFEMALPDGEVKWHTPISVALKHVRDIEKFAIPSATGDRYVRLDELDEALLAPVIAVLRAGIACDSYELVHQIKTPSGEELQILVRVLGIESDRYLGVLADISDPRETPWVVSDVADRLQLLVEHSPDGIVVHQDGQIVYANPAAAALVGEPSARIGVGRPLTDYLHPDHLGPMISRLAQMTGPGDVVKGHEAVLVRVDGTELPVEVASAHTTWGGKSAYQVILRDISERKRAEAEAEARLAAERQYAAAVESLEEGVVVMDAGGNVVAANESAERILGRRLHDGRSDKILTGTKRAKGENGEPLTSAQLPIRRALHEQCAVSDYVLGVSDEGGERQWLSVNVRPMCQQVSDDRSFDRAVISVSDITQRKQALERLEWEARNDPLTGLSNRNGFLAAVEALMGRTRPELESMVLFFFGLDRFKLVNDSLGHALGDEVLQVVGRRLRKVFPRAFCLGRLHGDEFVALAGGISDTDAALQEAESLRSEMSSPIQLSTGRTITVAPSIGLVRLSDVHGEASEIVFDADIAWQQAKLRTGNGVAIFDTGLREQTEARLELENDLRSAIQHNELRLEYQPIASLDTNRIVGFEALARWEHSTRGMLSPELFIPLAEESALINSLGEWALRTACDQMAHWQKQYPPARNCYVTVNVSAHQLARSNFMEVLQDALRVGGLHTGSLQLELTESAFISDGDAMMRVLGQIRDLGVRLSIDDFGTGFSSLSYLKRLPVSYLKVDRSFVSGLGSNPQDERIVALIAELGHGLHVRVIAEGVETRQQKVAAAKLGCDLYQGYLLARPIRPRDVPACWADS